MKCMISNMTHLSLCILHAIHLSYYKSNNTISVHTSTKLGNKMGTKNQPFPNTDSPPPSFFTNTAYGRFTWLAFYALEDHSFYSFNGSSHVTGREGRISACYYNIYLNHVRPSTSQPLVRRCSIRALNLVYGIHPSYETTCPKKLVTCKTTRPPSPPTKSRSIHHSILF